MIVVTLTDCPPALRGDLSKWMLEVQTGVFVGNVNARVREKLWERIIGHVKHGKAVMVYSANNEQGMEFHVHNSFWEVVDMEGIKLIRRPLTRKAGQGENNGNGQSLSSGFSNVSKFAKIRNIQRKLSYDQNSARQTTKNQYPTSFTIIDLETSGVDPINDEILEIAAVKVHDFEIEDYFSSLIHAEKAIPEAITSLTGIDQECLSREGVRLDEALKRLMSFLQNDTIVAHNANFDVNFLDHALEKNGMEKIHNKILDTCMIARRARLKVPDYKLSTLANHFQIEQSIHHRALPDCLTTREIFIRLIKTE